jgi:HEAT repeat protein
MALNEPFQVDPSHEGGPEKLDWAAGVELLNRIPGLPENERKATVEVLLRSSSQFLRQRTVAIAAALLADDRLLEMVEDDFDDVIRNAGLEILKVRGIRAFPVAVRLLSSNDPDLALQGVLILDHLRAPQALPYLEPLLSGADENVAHAAIVAVGHIGEARAITLLVPLLKAASWIRMAAIHALGDLGEPAAVAELTPLLKDPFLGMLAADSIARIGGKGAACTLVDHWLANPGGDEESVMLALLRHVLESLPRPPRLPKCLIDELGARLRHLDQTTRSAAAACVLTLGPSRHDRNALVVLASEGDPEVLPSCLRRRFDLTATLFAETMVQQLHAWGCLLAARYPASLPADLVVQYLQRDRHDEALASLDRTLSRIDHPGLAAGLLRLLAATPESQRSRLRRVLRSHRQAVLAELDRGTPVTPELALVVRSWLGTSLAGIVRELDALDPFARERVLRQLVDHAPTAARLPWARWIAEAPDVFLPLATDTAARHGLRRMLPLFRHMLERGADPALVRVVGELEDRDAVSILIRLRPTTTSLARALITEALGRIGGPEARQALAHLAVSSPPDEARLAYRALASCAETDDVELFLSSVANPDWMVRLAAADVLGRFPGTECLLALGLLTADPSKAVARRAASLLGS